MTIFLSAPQLKSICGADRFMFGCQTLHTHSVCASGSRSPAPLPLVCYWRPPSHCAAASCAVRRCLDFHNFLLLCLLLCPSCSVGCSAPTHRLGLHHTSRLHLSSCPSSSVDCRVAWCFAPTLLAQLCLVPWPPPLIAPLSFGCLLHWPSPWPIVLMVVMLPLVSGLCLSFMFMTVLGVVRRLSCHCTRPMQHLLPQGVTQRREQVQVDGVQCSRNTADVGPKS